MSSAATKREIERYKELYRKFHWGEPATGIVKLTDPRYPDWLLEMGRLQELHVRRNPRSRVEEWALREDTSPRAYLAFDPNEDHQPLYLVVPESVAAVTRKLHNPKDRTSLHRLAQRTRGHHRDRSYPRVQVTPVGVLTNAVYGTTKKGDGPSWYIHELGEESGCRPLVGVADDGTLWVAGGNYRVEVAGIID